MRSFPDRLTAESVGFKPFFAAVNHSSFPSADQAKPLEELKRLESVLPWPDKSIALITPGNPAGAGARRILYSRHAETHGRTRYSRGRDTARDPTGTRAGNAPSPQLPLPTANSGSPRHTRLRGMALAFSCTGFNPRAIWPLRSNRSWSATSLYRRSSTHGATQADPRGGPRPWTCRKGKSARVLRSSSIMRVPAGAPRGERGDSRSNRESRARYTIPPTASRSRISYEPICVPHNSCGIRTWKNEWHQIVNQPLDVDRPRDHSAF